MMLKYAGMMLLILMLVFVIALITPKLAAAIDKGRKKKPEKPVKQPDDGVRGIYDAQTTEKEDDTNSKNENGDAE